MLRGRRNIPSLGIACLGALSSLMPSEGVMAKTARHADTEAGPRPYLEGGNALTARLNAEEPAGASSSVVEAHNTVAVAPLVSAATPGFFRVSAPEPIDPTLSQATGSSSQTIDLTPAMAPPGTPVTPVARPQDAQRLNPSGRVLSIVAPLKDRELYLGDVEIQVMPDDAIRVSASQVLDLLSRGLSSGALEPLRLQALPGTFIPLEEYAALGLPLTFDARSLELSVEVPVSDRARQSIALAELDRENFGDFAEPEAFTAYLNLRSSIDYVHEGSNAGLGDPLFLIDGAARLYGVVLENEATWNGGDAGFSRDGTRLIYDDASRLNRWSVGDLEPQSQGFQGVADIAGIGVVRTYALLEPQRNVAPRGGRSFTLDRESTVEAFVNGRSVRTIRLQPGAYDVSDFPFVQGSNDVELIIVDDTGQREVVSFSLFIDRTQLVPGLSEYGLYGGVRSSRAGNGIDYSDDFTATGFYRYGLSENLTVGGNFQYEEDAALVGGEAVWGSEWGTIGGDVAISDISGTGSGWAANLSYERLTQTQNGGFSLLATVEARSANFGATGRLDPQNPYSINASVGVNQSFGDSSFAGVQIRYAHARDGFENESSVRVSYGRRLNTLTNVVFDVDWSRGGFADGTSFNIALVRRFGETGSARAEYDSQSERARLGYQTSGGRGVGAWSATGNLDTDSSTHAFNGSASYAANRADLGLTHSTAYSQSTDAISDQRTSVRAATGIAFAGGRFAVGRPVSDGFVIVEPYAGARDTVIQVEPSDEGYYAESGLFGPALYGQVSAFSPRTVIYDAPDAPPGFDVGQGSLRVLPPYRAGYLVTVGSEYGLTAIGRLLNREGEPLTLVTGTATEQGGEGREVQVFTNRQGVFGVGGLKAGRWRIVMLGELELTYEIVVPEAPEGVARLGDQQPNP